MRGLELSRRYWFEVGKPALTQACPQAAERWSVGLAGEGSECFGFDDDLSQDHDWGPGFCVWLDAPDFARFGDALQRAYLGLPHAFMGYERIVCPEGEHRVGVLKTQAFFRRFTGCDEPPRTVGQWMSLDDEALATCTNGQLFEDRAPGFRAYREELLRHYPRDIMLKKLAAHLALAGQAGQYNYPRCVRRGDVVAAHQALARFIDNAQAVVFLLNRAYRPYYKWANRALAELPVLGHACAEQIEQLVQGDPLGKAASIERLCGDIARELGRSGAVEGAEGGKGFAEDVRESLETPAGEIPFLVDVAREIQASITRESLRALPLMTFKL